MSQRPNDDTLDNLLDQIEQELFDDDIPLPSEDARVQAIFKANQTFDQAFTESTRPKDKSTDSFYRRFIMSVFSSKPLGPKFQYALGTVAAVGIAIPIYLSYEPEGDPSTVVHTASEIKVQQPEKGARLDPVVPSENDSINLKRKDDFVVLEESATIGGREQVIESEPVVVAPAPAETREDFNTTPSAPTTNSSKEQAKRNRTLAKIESEALVDSAASASAPVIVSQSKKMVPSRKELSRTAGIEPLGRIIMPKPLASEPSVTAPRPDSAEEYAHYERSSVVRVADNPVSTFSADVDTASYSLVRNQLNQGYLPAHSAVRPEEFINYFNYDYPVAKTTARPFKPTVSVMDSPWNEGKKLVHIGVKGYDIDQNEAPDSNIVFLVDVSGSMSAANKLPLAKQSIMFLAEQLKPTDKISIVVYAGAAGVVLEPTDAKYKTTLKSALSRLNAGGSTAGGAGIELAYQVAQQNFDEDAVNRIVLLTDGDFNVGQSSNQALLELVERKRKSGVMLSVLGFGRNNYQDDMMQTLAQNGNGIATYIDTLNEAKKVMVDEATSTLFPIAKDVKFQVEFNPATVSDYRLVGYETRALRTEDFNNDKVDAGDIGAGHTVTAIYEITPTDAKTQSVDAPRYSGNQAKIKDDTKTNEYGFVKVRYKLPKEDKSKLIEVPIKRNQTAPSRDAKFSIAVAGFAQLLSGNKHTGDLDYAKVAEMAQANKGGDEYGYRSEFIQLVKMAELIE